MDFTTFCEDVLGYPLSNWQKTYLTKMYDMIKKAKEENKEINIIMPGRGSSKYNGHIAALYLASEYDKYLKCLKGHKMDDIESLNAVMGPVKMARSDAIDEVLGNDKGKENG